MKKTIILMVFLIFILAYSCYSAVDCTQLSVYDLGKRTYICGRYQCGFSWECDENLMYHDYDGIICEFYESCMGCDIKSFVCDFDPSSEDINWKNPVHIIMMAESEYREQFLDYLWKMPNLAILGNVDSDLLNQLMYEKFGVDLEIGDDATVKVTEDGHLVSESLSLDFNLDGISGDQKIELTSEGFNYNGNVITDLDRFGWSNIDFTSAGVLINTGNNMHITLYSGSESSLYTDSFGLYLNGKGAVSDNSGFEITASSSDSKSRFEVNYNGDLTFLELEPGSGKYSVNGKLSDGQDFDFKGSEMTLDLEGMYGFFSGSTSLLILGDTYIVGKYGKSTYISFGGSENFGNPFFNGAQEMIWVDPNGNALCVGTVEFYNSNGFSYKGRGEGVKATYNSNTNKVIFDSNPKNVKDVADIVSPVNGNKAVRVIVTMDENGEYVFNYAYFELSELSGDEEYTLDELTILMPDSLSFVAEAAQLGNIKISTTGNAISIEAMELALSGSAIPTHTDMMCSLEGGYCIGRGGNCRVGSHPENGLCINAGDRCCLPDVPIDIDVGAGLTGVEGEQDYLALIRQYGCEAARKIGLGKFIECCDNYECSGNYESWRADFTCIGSSISCSGKTLIIKFKPIPEGYTTCSIGRCIYHSYTEYFSAGICDSNIIQSVECCNDNDCPNGKCVGAGTPAARCDPIIPLNVPQCTYNGECPRDYYCHNGKCTHGCENSDNCAPDKTCKGGRCEIANCEDLGGNCINTNTYSCSGSLLVGYCSGGSNMVCCLGNPIKQSSNTYEPGPTCGSIGGHCCAPSNICTGYILIQKTWDCPEGCYKSPGGTSAPSSG
jgi:hypothetical protein